MALLSLKFQTQELESTGRELDLRRRFTEAILESIPTGVISIGADGSIHRVNRALAGFDRFQYLRSVGLPPDCLLVGSMGELRTLKRHDDFIRAAALVVKTYPEAHFVLAGVDPSESGEVQKQLEALVIQLGLKDRFHFLGWLDEAEKLLCALDVFVSASETESFGLVIAEAMAAGTVVVATETEGAKEVIEDQTTGILVPIGDVPRIAAAVTAVLDDYNRREMGARAREAANAKFSLQRMVDEIENIYAAD